MRGRARDRERDRKGLNEIDNENRPRAYVSGGAVTEKVLNEIDNESRPRADREPTESRPRADVFVRFRVSKNQTNQTPKTQSILGGQNEEVSSIQLQLFLGAN